MSWGLLSNTVTRAGTRRADPQLFRLMLASEESTRFLPLPGRRKKLRFHPRQLYLSVKQGELQKVILMLCEYSPFTPPAHLIDHCLYTRLWSGSGGHSNEGPRTCPRAQQCTAARRGRAAVNSSGAGAPSSCLSGQCLSGQ